MNNIVHLFFEAAKQYADHTALVFKDQQCTYGTLHEQVLKTARYFEAKGITKGKKVLVFVPMSLDLYRTVLALFTLGAVVVFIDEWADRKRLQKALSVVKVDAVISKKKYLLIGYLLRLLRNISLKLSVPSLQKLEAKGRKTFFSDIQQGNPAEVGPDDMALITFTTGSTGLPKAANRTHGFLKAQFDVLKPEIGAQKDDRCLISLPIVLLSILGTGATGIVPNYNQRKPHKIDLKAQYQLLNQWKVSMIIASPFYIDLLSSSKEDTDIRKILTGGAPVFPDLAHRIRNAFPQSEIQVAYGSTEAEPIAVIDLNDIKLNEYGLLVGKVNAEIDLKIIRITDEPISIGPEGWDELEVPFGEIVVAGPHVLANYYNSEESFIRNKIIDGEKIWHRTGDSGRLVDDLLYLNGRCAQLIPGEKEYQSLFILEYQLSQMEQVELGTLVEQKVVIELQKDYYGNKEIQGKISNLIDSLGIIYDKVVYVKEIPRDPRHHSKIDYGKLREMLGN